MIAIGQTPAPQPPPLPAEVAGKKLTAMGHVLCGWPLILMFIGGAIGGALGGAAYGINVSIYKSRMPVIVKIILNLGTGIVAVVLWVLAASWVAAKLGRP